MEMAKEWEKRPKPKVTSPVPLDPASPKEYMDKVKLMYDMARLAFETDSTRSISLLLDSVNSPAIEFGDVKTSDGYHNLSHHGKSKEKLTQLKTIDEWHMKLLAELYSELKAVKEDGESLLDRTMILYGSNLGNANTHVTTNMPTILAGGRFQARPASCLRHAAQLSPAEHVCLNVATNGAGDGQVRIFDGDDAGVGAGVSSLGARQLTGLGKSCGPVFTILSERRITRSRILLEWPCHKERGG